MYAHMRQELDDGGRVYIVCPLVSASGAASLEGVKAAEQEHALLSAAGVFGSHAAGLLHGRMTAAEKAAALQAFQR
jgi:ATP-dependent DNA helicase RecG